MIPERLGILYVSQMPPSPPRIGAQARMHGLITELARRHDVTATMLIDDQFDVEECRRAMQTYCREVVLVRNPHGEAGLRKRLLQLRSLASTRSFERLRVRVPPMQQAPFRCADRGRPHARLRYSGTSNRAWAAINDRAAPKAAAE